MLPFLSHSPEQSNTARPPNIHVEGYDDVARCKKQEHRSLRRHGTQGEIMDQAFYLATSYQTEVTFTACLMFSCYLLVLRFLTFLPGFACFLFSPKNLRSNTFYLLQRCLGNAFSSQGQRRWAEWWATCWPRSSSQPPW